MTISITLPANASRSVFNAMAKALTEIGANNEDTYRREVLGQNSEGDPIGGDCPSEGGPLMEMAEACGAVDISAAGAPPEGAEVDPVVGQVKTITTPHGSVAIPVDPDSMFAESDAATPPPPAAGGPADPAIGEDTTLAPANTLYAGVDASGLPWNAQINSRAEKPKLAKTGCWKMKKNVAPDLVLKVQAELKAVMEVPVGGVVSAETTPDTAIPAPPAVEASVGDVPTPGQAAQPATTPANVAGAVATAAQPAATPATAVSVEASPVVGNAAAPGPGVSVPAAPAIAAGAVTNFPDLITAITAAGKTPEEQNAACVGVSEGKLTSIAMLAPRPDLIPAVAAALGL